MAFPNRRRVSKQRAIAKNYRIGSFPNLPFALQFFVPKNKKDTWDQQKRNQSRKSVTLKLRPK